MLLQGPPRGGVGTQVAPELLEKAGGAGRIVVWSNPARHTPRKEEETGGGANLDSQVQEKGTRKDDRDRSNTNPHSET